MFVLELHEAILIFTLSTWVYVSTLSIGVCTFTYISKNMTPYFWS